MKEKIAALAYGYVGLDAEVFQKNSFIRHLFKYLHNFTALDFEKYPNNAFLGNNFHRCLQNKKKSPKQQNL